MIETYPQAYSFLYSFVSYEHKIGWNYSEKTLNLKRCRQFLQRLGDPQKEIRPIHVAGSDGKGSTCAMISAALQAMGFRVGLFVSPHLEHVRERISINGQWISEEDFARWTEFLRRRMEEMPPFPGGYATFFELLTAMAFLYFREQRIDFSVIETGLGGRLDSTNVMDPLVTAITHISLEHTEQLGDTLEKIADEKLGITRPNVPIVIGSQDAALLPHFQRRLRKQQASVVFTDEGYRAVSLQNGRRYRTLSIEKVESGEKRIIQIPLFGHYQLQNVLTAIAVLDLMQEEGIVPPLASRTLHRGLRRLHWPGRFEIVRRTGKATVLLDVAHTAKGAASLRLSLDEIFPHKKRTFVIGCLQGKKISEMLESLIRPQDAVILTQAPSPRGETIENILKAIDRLDWVAIHGRIDNPVDAFRYAEAMTKKNGLLIVTGSLYLVGEIRKSLREKS
ncbi:MAG: folylpolyglutamate synthase/dihydrofolate synthase family protein [Candidatus Omnitrophota bacterium]